MAVTLNASTSNGLQISSDTSGEFQFQDDGTTNLTIKNDGSVGIGTTSPSTIVGIGGNSARSISLERHTTSNTAGNNLTVQAGGATSGATDKNGGNLVLSSGTATGTGSSVITFQTAAAGTTGTTDRSPAEVMRIDGSGNVGISTTSPSSLLHVKYSSSPTENYTSGTWASQIYNAYDSANYNGLVVGNRYYSATSTVFEVGSIYGSGTAWYSFYKVTGLGESIWSTGGTERMRITNAGEVWVARTTDAGAFNLQCGGTGVWGAGAYTNGSDERIKENIAPITSGLDVVEKLNPVTFQYKEDWSKNREVQTGFIAQDLLIALENKNYKDGIVDQSGEYLSVAYQSFIPILTKALQEANAKINALEARVKTLEGN